MNPDVTSYEMSLDVLCIVKENKKIEQTYNFNKDWLEHIQCIIAILRYFPLILLSENFPSHASRVRWKIIASN